MDAILRLSNEQTRIVPAAGPVMTRAEFKAERDLMEEVRSRVWKHVLHGDGPKDMLEGIVLKGLARTWKDPYKFLSRLGSEMADGGEPPLQAPQAVLHRSWTCFFNMVRT
jgi:hypothetical protein